MTHFRSIIVLLYVLWRFRSVSQDNLNEIFCQSTGHFNIHLSKINDTCRLLLCKRMPYRLRHTQIYINIHTCQFLCHSCASNAWFASELTDSHQTFNQMAVPWGCWSHQWTRHVHAPSHRGLVTNDSARINDLVARATIDCCALLTTHECNGPFKRMK